MKLIDKLKGILFKRNKVEPEKAPSPSMRFFNEEGLIEEEKKEETKFPEDPKPEKEYTPEEVEEIDTTFDGFQKAMSVYSLIRADIPEAVRNSDLGKEFQKNYATMVKDKMPLWMRLNYLCNGVSLLQSKNVPINWEMVHEIILIPQGQYGYDIDLSCKNVNDIYSLEPIQTLRDDVYEAQILDDLGVWKHRRCKVCGKEFFMTYSEVEWYRNKEYSVPRTCKYCRKGIQRPKEVEVAYKEEPEEEQKTAMQLAMEKAGIEV